MTTWRSNQTPDQSSTATMAGSFHRPSRRAWQPDSMSPHQRPHVRRMCPIWRGRPSRPSSRLRSPPSGRGPGSCVRVCRPSSAAVSTTARAAINVTTASHRTIRAATTGGRISEMTATLHVDREGGLRDIGRRLDQLPVGHVHRRVVMAVGLGLFFEVYEIFLSSTIATALKTQPCLGGTALQLLLASSFLGMFVGAAAFGWIADRIGRRRAFLLNLVWFSVWSVIGAVAPNPWMLVGARFMAGIGVGAEYPVADSYLSDVLPKAHRGRLAAWAYTCSFLAVPALGFLSLSLTAAACSASRVGESCCWSAPSAHYSSSCCAAACPSRRVAGRRGSHR